MHSARSGSSRFRRIRAGQPSRPRLTACPFARPDTENRTIEGNGPRDSHGCHRPRDQGARRLMGRPMPTGEFAAGVSLQDFRATAPAIPRSPSSPASCVPSRASPQASEACRSSLWSRTAICSVRGGRMVTSTSRRLAGELLHAVAGPEVALLPVVPELGQAGPFSCTHALVSSLQPAPSAVGTYLVWIRHTSTDAQTH